MTFVTITRAFVAANEVKTSEVSGKVYRVITVKEDTGYFDANDKWVETGTISYGLTARGNRARRTAGIGTGDEVTATMSHPRPFAYTDDEGNPGFKLTGNLESIGVISTRASRAAQRNTDERPQQQPAAPQETASPKEETKATARNSQQKMRTQRGQTPQQEGRPNLQLVAKHDGAEGKQHDESPEQYRARQTQQGQRADRQERATKAKTARDADRPQGTDLTACKDPECGGTFERRELTKAGYCKDHKRSRTAAQPANA
jgi:hypothetical protein